MLELIKKVTEEQVAEDKTGMCEEIKIILLSCAEESQTIAEIILQDLQNPDMSLEKCAEQMAKVAQKKATSIAGGKGYAMSKKEAVSIIREFYGISRIEATEQVKPAQKTYSLEDLI